VSVPSLFRRQEVWVPTPLGWLALLSLATGLVVAAVLGLYSFLAVNAPVRASTIIVEGWMDTEALDQVVRTLSHVSYERVLTTGGPRRVWPPNPELSTYADAAAHYLRHHGVPPQKVIAVPAPYVDEDRTWHNALAVRQWAIRNAVDLRAVDVYSLGAHTRRSRLLYSMALGEHAEVGAYAALSDEYSPENWWRTSVGARDVVDQALGYVWVKCCFWPRP
jgi:hypothetical protein